MQSFWFILTIFSLCYLALSEPCYLPVQFNCSQIDTYCQNQTEIYDQSDTVYDCLETLNLTAETIVLGGTYSGLQLTGSYIEINGMTVTGNLSIEGTFEDIYSE